MNNYEKIKQINFQKMSFEEVFEFISVPVCDRCIYCPEGDEDCNEIDCAEGVRQWLQQEYKKK
jgi:CO dehydrogenase/acetyl-CoA synthase alpha subunit